MNSPQIIVDKPICIDCMDWKDSLIIFMYFGFFLIGPIIVQTVRRLIKRQKITFSLPEYFYWMVILAIIELTYFFIQSNLQK